MKSKIFKKIIGSFLCFNLILILSPVELVKAQTTDKVIVEKATENTFDMISMDRSTFIGSGGSCRLDYMSGSNCISWGVSLNVGLASFVGDIYVSGMSSSNNYYRDFPISGSGGVVYLPSLPSGSYSVTIIGTGIGLDGRSYNTVPNARISFYK